VTRFVIDAATAIELASADVSVAERHELLAPTLLRSQVLSSLHEAVQRGELTVGRAWQLHDRITRMSIRLLGDAVLRRRAWQLADSLGWASTYDAEYLALTQLQADALITADPDLSRRLEAVVKVATIDDLREPASD
jgi:indolepyruvate ferredoxin oxidoreductase alpha subunit